MVFWGEKGAFYGFLALWGEDGTKHHGGGGQSEGIRGQNGEDIRGSGGGTWGDTGGGNTMVGTMGGEHNGGTQTHMGCL